MNRLAEWMSHRNRVLVMGILNVTPDSFHDGGRHPHPKEAIEAALAMEAEGADIVDVGGESTRPGAEPVPADEEIERILPVIEGLRRRSEIAISVDTTKADVATAAIDAGAQLVNDISALRFDDRMASAIASSGAFAVLMHMQGRPTTMQQDASYDDVVQEVCEFLSDQIRAAVAAGIETERIIVDPGIGFGKRLEHNLALLRNLHRLVELGRPVIAGVSRKSFLGRMLDLPSSERLEGTIAANAVAIANGADVIRVHDVKEGRRTADVAFHLRKNGL